MEISGLFDRQAKAYASYRPTYPQKLYDLLLSRTDQPKILWDCATGNGQVAHAIVDQVDRVYATDVSASQLSQCVRHPHIEYYQASAEQSSLPDASIDLTIVAQAIHWLDHEAFGRELRRVTRPGGYFACWGYGLSDIDPEIDALQQELFDNILGPYWHPRRYLIDAQYNTIDFSFIEEIPFDWPMMHVEWTLDQWCGYLGSGSAYVDYREKNNRDPMEDQLQMLKALWPEGSSRTVRWQLFGKLGRVRL